MARTNTYDIGDKPRIAAVFQANSVDADPTTIRFKYKNPAGTTTTLTYGVDGALVKDATGNYHVDLELSAAGTWFYRFEGTGTVVAAEEGVLSVRSSNF